MASHRKSDEEQAFLAAYDPARYERLSVAVDVSLLTVADGTLQTWLVRRARPPQRGRWALPGVFVRPHESLAEAAVRALWDKSALRDVYLEQLYSFGAVDRDPRTRVISVAYFALIDASRLKALRMLEDEQACLAEVEVPWAEETGGPVAAVNEGRSLKLAFDHAHQLGMAVQRIRGKLAYAPIGFQLLRAQFTLRDLQHVHEVVLGRRLNKDSFRRKMLASGQLEATGEHQAEVDHRPAELYRFVRRSAL